MWLKDPKTKEKSVTLTVFVITTLVALVKLLGAGLTIGSFSLAPFSGTEFAAVLSAAGAIYWSRRNLKIKNENNKQEINNG